jgi:putative tricarboxylic transport membrane protein
VTPEGEQEAAPTGPAPARAPRRSELGLAAFVAAVGVWLLIETVGLQVPATTNVIGPKFFPSLVGVALVLVAGLLAWEALRPRGAAGGSGHAVPAPPGDWRTLGLLAGTLGVHLALLAFIGYITAAAALFWGAALALGSRHRLRDLVVGLALGVVLYLACTRGLSLTLPRGALERALS